MKKIVLLLVGLMASGASLAATNQKALSGGAQNSVLRSECDLLANDIKVAVSQNAIGNLACNEDDNVVAVSICHTAGMTNERTDVVLKDYTGTIECTVTTSENCIKTISGATFPTATTNDGTVTRVFPDLTCSETNVSTVAGALAVPQ